jgi:hypothetical protein
MEELASTGFAVRDAQEDIEKMLLDGSDAGVGDTRSLGFCP